MLLPGTLLLLLAAPSQINGGVLEQHLEVAGSSAELIIGVFAGGRDLDGDGLNDFALAREGPTRVQAYAGASGVLLWSIVVPGNPPWVFDYSLCLVADVNGDGRSEVAVGDSNAGVVHLHSGADGALLWSRSDASLGGMGLCLDSGGDLSGDGTADVLAYAPWAQHPTSLAKGACVVLSGAHGSIVRIFYEAIVWSQSTSGRRIASAGDVDGDGLDDVLAGFVTGSGIRGTLLLSGATGSLIRAYAESEEWFGASVANAGDLDRDGVPDQLIAAPGAGRVIAYSGASGARLWSCLSPAGVGASWFGKGLSACGDVDGDAIPDLLAGAPQYREFLADAFGAVFVLSGRDGLVLAKLRGAPGTRIGQNADALGDVNGDGIPEFLHGGPPQSYGTSDLGRVTASAWHAGLFASSDRVSATRGGAIRFRVEFPDSEAGQGYKILASRTGVGPTEWRGLIVPLAFDGLTRRLAGAPPAFFHGAHGSLDSRGDAVALLDLAPSVALPWLGSTIWLAAVTGAAGQPHASSIARRVTFLP